MIIVVTNDMHLAPVLTKVLPKDEYIVVFSTQCKQVVEIYDTLANRL